MSDEECMEEWLCWSIDDSVEACWPCGTRQRGLDLVPGWPSAPLLGSSTRESIEGGEPDTAMTDTSVLLLRLVFETDVPPLRSAFKQCLVVLHGLQTTLCGPTSFHYIRHMPDPPHCSHLRWQCTMAA